MNNFTPPWTSLNHLHWYKNKRAVPKMTLILSYTAAGQLTKTRRLRRSLFFLKTNNCLHVHRILKIERMKHEIDLDFDK